MSYRKDYYPNPSNPVRPRKYKRVRRELIVKRSELHPPTLVKVWKEFAKKWGVDPEDVKIGPTYYAGVEFWTWTEETDKEFQTRVNKYNKAVKDKERRDAKWKLEELQNQTRREAELKKDSKALARAIAVALKDDPSLRNEVLSGLGIPGKPRSTEMVNK